MPVIRIQPDSDDSEIEFRFRESSDEPETEEAMPVAQKTVTGGSSKAESSSFEKVVTAGGPKAGSRSPEKAVSSSSEKAVTAGGPKAGSRSPEKAVTAETSKTISSSSEKAVTAGGSEAVSNTSDIQVALRGNIINHYTPSDKVRYDAPFKFRPPVMDFVMFEENLKGGGQEDGLVDLVSEGESGSDSEGESLQQIMSDEEIGSDESSIQSNKSVEESSDEEAVEQIKSEEDSCDVIFEEEAERHIESEEESVDEICEEETEQEVKSEEESDDEILEVDAPQEIELDEESDEESCEEEETPQHIELHDESDDESCGDETPEEIELGGESEEETPLQIAIDRETASEKRLLKASGHKDPRRNHPQHVSIESEDESPEEEEKPTSRSRVQSGDVEVLREVQTISSDEEIERRNGETNLCRKIKQNMQLIQERNFQDDTSIQVVKEKLTPKVQAQRRMQRPSEKENVEEREGAEIPNMKGWKEPEIIVESDPDEAPQDITLVDGRKMAEALMKEASLNVQKLKEKVKEKERRKHKTLKLQKEKKLRHQMQEHDEAAEDVVEVPVLTQEDLLCLNKRKTFDDDGSSPKKRKKSLASKDRNVEHIESDSHDRESDCQLVSDRKETQVQSKWLKRKLKHRQTELTRLPLEVLQDLPDVLEVPVNMYVSSTPPQHPKKSKSKSKSKKHTRSPIETGGLKTKPVLDYIPLDCPGATEFGVVPLHQAMKKPKTIAEQAASFRQDMLYGNRIKREDTKRSMVYSSKLQAAGKHKLVQAYSSR